MPTLHSRAIVVWLLILVANDPTHGADAPALFAKRVLPLLRSKCFGCHGSQKAEGGLRLDLRKSAFAGGDSGKVIVPRQASRSALFKRLLEKDKSLRMPLDRPPLSPVEIALIKRWIDSGASWPDKLAGRRKKSRHWSFQPVRRPRLSGRGNPIDLLIESRLQRAGLRRSSRAARTTLVRRLYLDLLGLPPTLQQVQSFVSDQHPLAYEQLVDQLLALPHFGERWGRHWLDLARFAETDGYENDKSRPHAFRFRDWVIRAFNHDLPFDQFTIEQLAGDLLPKPNGDQVAATGFHRNTLWNSAASADKEEFRIRAVKDRTNTTGTVWMGLTLGCCQCHSHKYDPIAHHEYYRMYAFFNRTDNQTVQTSTGPALALQAVRRPSFVHRRGNFLSRGNQVVPGTPEFLHELRKRGQQAHRLDLARWIVDPRHPLTARVAANRFWQHLFGRGLVPTPENFGSNGEPPTHPRLLDWLAAELIHVDWSRKRLLRTIVLSETYRQSSRVQSDRVHKRAADVDPLNRLLWRQNRFRVEGEIVRDLALAASGLLVDRQFGPSMVPPFPRGLLSHSLTNENLRRPGGGRFRRGIYVHVQRTMTFPTLAAFDVADGNQTCVRRDRSITPMQALTLLNDPVFTECAQALATRIQRVKPDQRINAAFELALARQPTAAERAVIKQLLVRQQRLGATEKQQWHGVARTLINLEEFVTRE